MTTFQDKLDQIASEILERLKKSYQEKKMVATGKTVASLRKEVTEKGFKIFGAKWIDFTEFGRGPSQGSGQGGSNFLDNLLEWAKAVGFPEWRVRFLKYYINKFGTRLHRGQDPRFSGNQSKVITDVINEMLVEEIKTRTAFAVLESYKTEIRKIIQ
jgi:hypothetical protein